MIRTGLLSVTFRQLDVSRIVRLVADAGLDAIEWGGDVHVPPGDTRRAEAARRMSTDSGVRISSYGSYYRLGGTRLASDAFDKVLESAVTLQAPSIRVWAGDVGSAEATTSYRRRVAEDAVRICELSRRRGVAIDLEYHARTLTDGIDSTLTLLTEVGQSNLRCNWQPAEAESVSEREHSLRRLAPWLANIHVAHCEADKRLPLAAGTGEWEGYLSVVGGTERQHYAMLEFVMDDSEEQFQHDARTLKEVIARVA